MTKLIEVIKNIKPEFEKVRKYLRGTEEKIENFSHEELAEKFGRMTDEFYAMLEQIYEAYEDSGIGYSTEDKEPFAYKWNHSNGNDFIITRASGNNTYFGKIASDLMFEMQKRQRNNEFSGMEFNNKLIIELNNKSKWSRGSLEHAPEERAEHQPTEQSKAQAKTGAGEKNG